MVAVDLDLLNLLGCAFECACACASTLYDQNTEFQRRRSSYSGDISIFLKRRKRKCNDIYTRHQNKTPQRKKKEEEEEEAGRC